MVWNEYPMEEIGVIEGNEHINSIENESEPFVGQCFLRQILRVMELEKDVKHGDLPFFKSDIHNLYVKMRRMHAMNDLWVSYNCAKLKEF